MSGIISDNVGRASGLVKAVSVSQDYVKLAEIDCSATTPSLVSFDNVFTTDYQVYKIYISGQTFTSGTSGEWNMRFTNAGTPYTASVHRWYAQGMYNGANVWDYNHQSDVDFPFGTWSTTETATNTEQVQAWDLTIYDPLNAGIHTLMTFQGMSWEAAGAYVFNSHGALTYNDGVVINGVDFYHAHSLTFAKGKFFVYGLKSTL